MYYIIPLFEPEPEKLFLLLELLEGRPVILVNNSEKVKLAVCNSHIHIINNPKNVGFGGGANVGIQYALEKDAQWIILLNQDLTISKNGAVELEKVILTCKPGIAGPFFGKLERKRWTTILPHKKTDYISGSCMAIHASVFRKIGYFYEPYFMYYEDADFCVRAKKAGFPLTHVPLAGVSHQETTSLHRGSFAHQYYLSRNHLLFVRRQGPLFVKVREMIRLPKTIWEHHRRQEDGAIVGIRDYFLGHFGRLTKIV